MKEEYLYYKQQMEEDEKLRAEIKSEQARMTAEEYEAEVRANVDRFTSLWEEYKNREKIVTKNALRLYVLMLWKTELIAHDYGLDLRAEWDQESGWIELVFDILLSDSTANPLHLHLMRMFEQCNSYSLMTTNRYGRELAMLTFHFSFIFYPGPGDN